MKDSDPDALELTPELVLRAYGAGVFPMAEDASSDEIYWVDPRKRGILPLNGFHLSRSLRKRLLRQGYRVRIDTAFSEVLESCADREETWINPQIRELFHQLHRMGYAHSVEVWRDSDLIGGLYGLRLGLRSLAKACSARNVTDQKSHWPGWLHDCALGDSRCWIRSSQRRILKAWARAWYRAGIITSY